MKTWTAMDGKTYGERQIGGLFATESDARAFVIGLGGRLVRERMAGAIYRAENPTRAFRVTRADYSAKYIVVESVEVTR